MRMRLTLAHWQVRVLAAHLPDLPHLAHLDLGEASCRCPHHPLHPPRLLGLLSPPGRQCGAALMFLPRLRSLAATDVTTDWLHSLALFCPRLTSLAISRCTTSCSRLGLLPDAQLQSV